MKPALTILLVLVLASAAFAQAPVEISTAPAPSPPSDAPPAVSLADRLPGLPGRLSALRPAGPETYLELGEEVLAESRTPAERTLARQLFALALDLASQPGPRARTTRASSLLALAATSAAPGERRWLLALAQSQATPTEPTRDQPDLAPSAVEPGALDAATVIDYARSGDGFRASRLLERPEVALLIDRYDRVLDPQGLTGGAERVRRLVATYRTCTECANRRWVKDKDGVHLCPRCDGHLAPRLSREELVAQLRAEAVLLSGEQLSWASQALVDGGAPLRDPDLSEVAPTFGVSAATPIWNAGTWSAPPSPPEAPKPESPKADAPANP